MLRRLSLAIVFMLCGHAAAGQTLRDQLRTELFTFGTCGQPLCLAGDLSQHGGHFIPSAETGTASLLDFIGDALSTSVANAPISSASSGVTFQFVGGVPVKTATSAGPIFGERAQTLGKGRFFVGANITQMHFERLRGIRMDDLTFNFTHANIAPTDTMGSPSFENDVVRVQVAMNINLIVTTLVASYGLVDGVDLSLAVPVVRTSIEGTSVATIIPFEFPTPHMFAGTPSNPVLTAVSGVNGAASGIGDVVGRVKINLGQTDHVGVSVLVDARFPTGDENNFTGAGAFSGRGLGIVSAKFGTVTPHLNFGYTFRDGALQNNTIVANGGFDNALAPWATFAFDLLSEWQIGASKFVVPGPVQYQAPFPHQVSPTNIPNQPDNYLSSSIGFKFQTHRGIIIVTNALFPLRDSGMQPDVVWTGGLEYNF